MQSVSSWILWSCLLHVTDVSFTFLLILKKDMSAEIPLVGQLGWGRTFGTEFSDYSQEGGSLSIPGFPPHAKREGRHGQASGSPHPQDRPFLLSHPLHGPNFMLCSPTLLSPRHHNLLCGKYLIHKFSLRCEGKVMDDFYQRMCRFYFILLHCTMIAWTTPVAPEANILSQLL